MKLLVLISEIKYSGAAKIVTWLCNNLSANGHDITLVTYMGDADGYQVCDSVERLRFSLGNVGHYKRTIRAIKSLRTEIKRTKYDAVLSFLPMECFIALTSTLFTKTKVIVAERSDPYLERSTVANFCRFMFRFADGAVFQSSGAQKYFPQKLQKKSVIIENPIINPPTDIIDYEKRNLDIVTASRLDIHQKRQDILLRAFAAVLKSKPNARLKIYGDGPDEKNLKELACALGVERNVTFAGRTSQVLEKIKYARVFAFSSDFEGMPNVLLEALSVGVPVVTTDFSPGGAYELVENKGRGYVVPSGDEQKLAERILNILNNSYNAKKMAEKARDACVDYSEDAIFQKWERFIIRILEEEGNP